MSAFILIQPLYSYNLLIIYNLGSTLPIASGKFPNCQFRFGMGYKPDPNTDYSAGDYITIWIGSPSTTHGTDFNRNLIVLILIKKYE